MSKLVYGKEAQVRFKNEEEKKEVFGLDKFDNVDFSIHENNQNQGAWGSEDRIHFKHETGIPDCLKRNMTAGNKSVYGRINCKELCDELRK